MTHFNLRTDMLMAVAEAKSTEETRYYLNGVYVHPHPNGGVMMVATDGHILALAHDEHGEAPRGAILSMNFKQKGLKATRREKGGRRLIIDDEAFSNGDKRIASGEIQAFPGAYMPGDDGMVEDAVSVKEIDGTFPSYWHVVPAHATPSCEGSRDYGWSPDLITRAWRAAKIMGGSQGLSFNQKCAGDLAIVRVNDVHEIFFVIMPRRVGDTSRPDWYVGEPAKLAAE